MVYRILFTANAKALFGYGCQGDYCGLGDSREEDENNDLGDKRDWDD